MVIKNRKKFEFPLPLAASSEADSASSQLSMREFFSHFENDGNIALVFTLIKGVGVEFTEFGFCSPFPLDKRTLLHR